jgi:hypothetical protein
MAKPKTELNDFVASFRIPKALKTKIEEWLKDHPVTGCESANQYLRKLAIDRFTEVGPNGETLLRYANPEDDKESPEIASTKRKILAAQSPVAAG